MMQAFLLGFAAGWAVGCWLAIRTHHDSHRMRASCGFYVGKQVFTCKAEGAQQ